MTKIVYNACYGGFGLSPEATLRLYEMGSPSVKAIPVDLYFPVEDRHRDSILGYNSAIKGWREYLAVQHDNSNLFLTVFSPDEKFVLCGRDATRHDPMLVSVVEEMGAAASGCCAKLAIADVPSGSKYWIDEYDGMESVATPDSYNWQIAP